MTSNAGLRSLIKSQYEAQKLFRSTEFSDEEAIGDTKNKKVCAQRCSQYQIQLCTLKIMSGILLILFCKFNAINF